MKTALVVLMMIVSTQAQAKLNLDPKFRDKIQSACLTKNFPNKERICACIAQAHFDGARGERDEKEAVNTLNWAVKFYSAKNSKEADLVAAEDEIMAEFDAGVAERCARSR